ncbi:acyl carrier protein [Algibacter luteus]|uniref:Acyl carrier protein n=1 Tax=Algibacter luteus TaxID=1178825 RepID=A0A1M6BTB4_9FLAO|nr:acyl carrier protein [Algibacter luteus]SHI51823.1 Acyl carrier protein [Algibacter luteus]
MEESIIKHIEQELANEEIEDGLELTDDLLGSGILDSLGMMKLISFIEEAYSIQVAPEEMVIENFMTVESICKYINSKV